MNRRKTARAKGHTASPLVNLSGGSEPYPGYQLIRFLGRGAYGDVWQSTSPMGMDVALKFLRCNTHSKASREIRALNAIRQLDHPHLVTVYNIWADLGYIVIAMELAEGTLHDLLEVSIDESNQALPGGLVCHFMRQAALAIDFMNARQHQINNVRVAFRHCDIKPSNLLLFEDEAKVTDFSFSAMTTSSMWYYEKVGTLNYAAPEVFQGQISDRSDLYSLAVTYCQLRTGLLPFPPPPRTFDSRYVRPAPDLSRLTTEEQPIIARALSPGPHERYSTCLEMVDRLQQVVG